MLECVVDPVVRSVIVVVIVGIVSVIVASSVPMAVDGSVASAVMDFLVVTATFARPVVVVMPVRVSKAKVAPVLAVSSRASAHEETRQMRRRKRAPCW